MHCQYGCRHTIHFGTRKTSTLLWRLVFALLSFPGRPTYCRAARTVRWYILGKKKPPRFCGGWCSHYLSSQAVTRQVLSAQMSLTSVFGMGTGGPSSQSIRTHSWKRFSPSYLKPVHGFLLFAASSSFFNLVTHTGFEPMLTAWEAAVLTTWPMGHWCSFRDSNPGPTD